jgi:hypothetical protein
MRAQEDAVSAPGVPAAPVASVTGAAGDGNPTRRALFRGAAGVGAAGVAAAALSGLGGRAAADRTKADRGADSRVIGEPDHGQKAADPAEQIVVHVKDAAAGHIDLYRGAGLVRLHDPELARRLARLSRP